MPKLVRRLVKPNWQTDIADFLYQPSVYPNFEEAFFEMRSKIMNDGVLHKKTKILKTCFSI